MTIRFGKVVSTDEARGCISELGFIGNTAAFVAWVTLKNPDGVHVSVPEDQHLRMRYRNLCAMSFWKSGDRSGILDLVAVSEWSTNWTFVAFREVQQS